MGSNLHTALHRCLHGRSSIMRPYVDAPMAILPPCGPALLFSWPYALPLLGYGLHVTILPPRSPVLFSRSFFLLAVLHIVCMVVLSPMAIAFLRPCIVVLVVVHPPRGPRPLFQWSFTLLALIRPPHDCFSSSYPCTGVSATVLPPRNPVLLFPWAFFLSRPFILPLLGSGLPVAVLSSRGPALVFSRSFFLPAALYHCSCGHSSFCSVLSLTAVHPSRNPALIFLQPFTLLAVLHYPSRGLESLFLWPFALSAWI